MSDPASDPADAAFGEALAAGRRAPAPAFRGGLRRHLLAADADYGSRPPQLWLLVAAAVTVGLLILLVALLQALGSL